MRTTTISSSQFNRAVGRAKNAARSGPVIITDCGNRTHVLLTFAAYRSLAGPGGKIAELLAMPGASDIDFDIDISPRRDLARPAKFD